MRLLVFFQLAILILIASFLSETANAHGSGPPFLLINDKYAQTNLYYLGDPVFKPGIPWDLAPDRYLVGKDIKFKIDATALLIPEDVVKKSTIRWKWGDETKDYFYGLETSHKYDKTGSYLLEIEAKAPGQGEFILFDSVQMDIVPSMDYKLPTAKIALLRGTFKKGESVKFISQTTSDSSTKITSQWFFPDTKEFRDGVSADHTFADQSFGSDYALLQVKDDNGFIAHSIVRVFEEDGVLKFVDVKTVGQEAEVLDKIPSNTTKSGLLNSPLVYLTLVIVFGTGTTFFLIQRFKR